MRQESLEKFERAAPRAVGCWKYLQQDSTAPADKHVEEEAAFCHRCSGGCNRNIGNVCTCSGDAWPSRPSAGCKCRTCPVLTHSAADQDKEMEFLHFLQDRMRVHRAALAREELVKWVPYGNKPLQAIQLERSRKSQTDALTLSALLAYLVVRTMCIEVLRARYARRLCRRKLPCPQLRCIFSSPKRRASH